MEKIKLEKTKSGIMCLWECGGAYTNTGTARIISNKNGNPKKAIFIRTSGTLACDNHALIPVVIEDVIVVCNRWRSDVEIGLYKITNIDTMENIAEVKELLFEKLNVSQVEEYIMGNIYKNAVMAALNKSKDYHCRTAYYYISK